MPDIDQEIDSSDDESSDSDGEEETTDDRGWTEIQMPEPDVDNDIGVILRHSSEVTNIPGHVEEPVDYFYLFFDTEILDGIVRETNRYAADILTSAEGIEWLTLHTKSRLSRWPEDGITTVQLKAYLGLTINMGVIGKKKKLVHYWTKTESQETPYFGKVMPFWEYCLINRMLHLADNHLEVPRGQPGYDPWSKVRPILDRINLISKKYYVPSRYVSIDESLVGMKNRVIFIQYLPNKRHSRFGIKKFELCDSNGYVIHVKLYAGKDLDISMEDGQAIGVVKYLLQESRLLQRGFHLFTDNFYTKPDLADFLVDNGTHLTGTVRKNSKNLPANISQLKLSVKEAKAYRKGKKLVMAFREKKSQRNPVLVLSTAHSAKMITKTIRGKEQTKPEPVMDYNKYMGGVDMSDKKIYHFAAERSTRRYWKKIFFNFVDMSLLNSYILYITHNQATKKMERRQFIISVLESLCSEKRLERDPLFVPTSSPSSRPPTPSTPRPRPTQTPRPTSTTPPPLTQFHRLTLLPGKKEMDCYVCSDRSQPKGRKRSRHWCARCSVGCHERCEERLNHCDGLKKRKKN